MPTDSARLRAYREYLDFYNGKQWTASPQSGVRQQTFNYARAFVHKAASYLFGRPYGLTVLPAGEGATDARAAELERLLRAEYDRLDLYALDYDTAVDAAVLGDGAFKVVWDASAGQLSVTAVDPQTLDARFAPDDYRRLTSVTQTYDLPAATAAERFGKAVFSRDPAGNVHVAETWTPGELVITVEDAPVYQAANPLGEVPFIIFPNVRRPKSPWGDSDLVDLVGINGELNSRMSILSRILEISGNPIAVLENVDSGDNIKVGPGELWELPQGAKAYLLDLLAGGGAKIHLEYIDVLYRALHDLGETPRTAFGDSGRVVSGAALEVELQPLIQKVNRKRAIWQAVIRRRSDLMLRYLSAHGAGDVAGYTVAVQWPSLLPDDRSQLVADEVALVQNGIHSHQRAMDVLGEPDPEAEWIRVQSEKSTGELKVESGK